MNRSDHYAVATMRDLLGMLVDGAGHGAGGTIARHTGALSTQLACEREHDALCERINASLNVCSQLLDSLAARHITDEHAE